MLHVKKCVVIMHGDVHSYVQMVLPTLILVEDFICKLIQVAATEVGSLFSQWATNNFNNGPVPFKCHSNTCQRSSMHTMQPLLMAPITPVLSCYDMSECPIKKVKLFSFFLLQSRACH